MSTTRLRLKRALATLSLAAAAAAWPATAGAQKAGDGQASHLRFVDTVARLDLESVTNSIVSHDGKFVYCTAWQALSNVVFARDPATGALSHRQTIANPDYLDGTTGMALSPDQKRVVATAFSSKTTVLYDRDPETGRLDVADIAHEGDEGVTGLAYPVDVAFSADGRFIYVVDDRGSGGKNEGAITVFRVDDGKLRWVESFGGADGCLAGGRGIAVHPDGKTLIVAANRASALVVLDRDKETGKLGIRQVLKDDENQIRGLGGVMRVVFSPDFKFAYTSSGRFEGDSAVGSYRLGDDGKLARLQEFFGEGKELRDFIGGNHLIVSPDGRNVYVTATRSSTLVCFERDPKTGLLTYTETLSDGGGSGQLGGAAGVGVSPDSKYVYVAAENDQAVTVLRRDPPPSP